MAAIVLQLPRHCRLSQWIEPTRAENLKNVRFVSHAILQSLLVVLSARSPFIDALSHSTQKNDETKEKL